MHAAISVLQCYVAPLYTCSSCSLISCYLPPAILPVVVITILPPPLFVFSGFQYSVSFGFAMSLCFRYRSALSWYCRCCPGLLRKSLSHPLTIRPSRLSLTPVVLLLLRTICFARGRCSFAYLVASLTSMLSMYIDVPFAISPLCIRCRWPTTRRSCGRGYVQRILAQSRRVIASMYCPGMAGCPCPDV